MKSVHRRTHRQRLSGARFSKFPHAESLEPRMLLAMWPIDGPIRVSDPNTLLQHGSDVSIDGAGNFVATWMYDFADNRKTEIYARRYNASGTAIGPAFPVNTYTNDQQFSPMIAMTDSGDFVITWFSSGVDGSGWGVSARLFDRFGNPRGNEFVVNTHTTYNQQVPDIAMLDSGEFIITWTSGQWNDIPGSQDGSDNGVYAQRFDANGNRVGGEFRANTYTTGSQAVSSIGMDDAGNFVISWESADQDGSDLGIFARRFSSNGAPIGSEFQVNQVTNYRQIYSAVSVNGSGSFVIGWESNALSGGSEEIRARRYDASGAALSGEFAINSYTTGSQIGAHVHLADDGTLVATWSSVDQDGDTWGAFAAAFDGSNQRIGNEIQVNEHTTFQQTAYAVAMNSSGDLIIGWTDNDAFPAQGAFVRRYALARPATSQVVGDRVWRDSNANGIQDAGETGIANVLVELFDMSGTRQDSMVTDANGNYGFPVPHDRSYQLRFSLPDGYIFTAAKQGGDPSQDSDADALTGLTPTLIAGASGTSDPSLDAGMLLVSRLSGSVFFDRNNNSLWEPLEERPANVAVFADYDSDGVHDASEPYALSGSGGEFELQVRSGTYPLGIGDPALWTGPSQRPLIAVGPEEVIGGIQLAVRTPVPDTAMFAEPVQYLVNAYTTNAQSAPSVASDDDGNTVLVWQSVQQDGDSSGIFGRRYHSNGSPVGNEFQVNQYSTGSQFSPSVRMHPAGGFVVVWQGAGASDTTGIFARRFGVDGMPITGEVLVNLYTTGTQLEPAIAVDSDGNTVITWSGAGSGDSAGIYARRFNPNLIPQEDGFLVNSITLNTQFTPSIAAGPDGEFFIAWTTSNTVWARRFNSSAAALGAEAEIGGGVSTTRSLAGDEHGNYFVAWTGPSDGSSSGIFARRYDAALDAFGPAIRVNSYTTGAQTLPAIDTSRSGDLVITWQSAGQDGGDLGIYALRFNAAGIAQGNEFRVNTYTSGTQASPSVTVHGSGFLIAWSGAGTGDSSGCSARWFDVSPAAPVSYSFFNWRIAPQSAEFSLVSPDPNLATAMTPANLVLVNAVSGAVIPTSAIQFAWKPVHNLATFSFPGYSNGMLPNGRYRATIYPGNTPALYTQTLEFWVLHGDANRDERVDLHDLIILANNWMSTSNVDYATGDFNGDGTVNHSDLAVLSLNWQLSLPAAPPPQAVAVSILRRAPARTPTRTENPVAELVTSTASRPSTRAPTRLN